MQSRGIARVALLLGGLAAVASWWSFAATQTVFDVEATRDTATSLFAAKPIQDNAIKSLSEQLASLLPSSTSSQNAAAQQAATAALADPKVVAAFGAAISSLHEQLLADGPKSNDIAIDTSAVTAAVKDRLASIDPALAASIKDDSLSIKFDTGDIPNLSGPKAAAPKIAVFGAFAAIALSALAILLHPEPFVAVRGVGRRLIGIGMIPVVMWVIVPWLLRKFEADAAQTLSPLASGYGKRLAGPALILACLGLGIWVAGRFSSPALKAAGKLSRSASNAAQTINDAQHVHTQNATRPRRAGKANPCTATDRVDVKL